MLLYLFTSTSTFWDYLKKQSELREYIHTYTHTYSTCYYYVITRTRYYSVDDNKVKLNSLHICIVVILCIWS